MYGVKMNKDNQQTYRVYAEITLNHDFWVDTDPVVGYNKDNRMYHSTLASALASGLSLNKFFGTWDVPNHAGAVANPEGPCYSRETNNNGWYIKYLPIRQW